jgi:hypothetical protein
MKNYQLQCFCENLIDNLTVIKGYLDLSRESTEIKFSNELTSEIADMTAKIKRCLIQTIEQE